MRRLGPRVGFIGALVVAVIVACAGIAPSGGATRSATGTLDLHAILRLTSSLGECPAGVSAEVCAARTGEGIVPGLGSVTETYTFIADLEASQCPPGSGKARAYPVRLSIAGKGEIELALAVGNECVDQEALRTQAQVFTVSGGTGIYVGASGSGRVERSLRGMTTAGRVGQETWTGTLLVPGISFDVTPPMLSGAVSKTVRAARGARMARVSFTVIANDDLDGILPATCTPRSGSRFRLGKTRVTCSATDNSGNAATATFVITVRRRR